MTQGQFYNSAAWKRLSKTFLISKLHICERCGNLAEIAHHTTHLTPRNVIDPDISLNIKRLQALCLECHNTVHYAAASAVLQGLEFDENGDLRKGKNNE